jgi:hypothetical protein
MLTGEAFRPYRRSTADMVAAFNAVPITRAQLEVAIQDSDKRPAVPEADALRARVTALAAWRSAHDPRRASNDPAMLDAAAMFPLGLLDGGLGFEPAGFQDMIMFIEEMPW